MDELYTDYYTDYDEQFEYLVHLIKHHPEHVNPMLTQNLAYGYDGTATLLHYAAENNQVGIVKRLLELGADVDSSPEDGKTPLMYAVAQKSTEAVSVLLEANADIHMTDIDEKSVLHMIFHRYYDDDETAELILLKLHKESSTIDELVEQLTAAGCSFYSASLLQNVDVLERMLQRGCNVNSSNVEGRTALHVAAGKNNLDLAKWLLDNGANIEARDLCGLSPLDTAGSENAAMVEFFLIIGAQF